MEKIINKKKQGSIADVLKDAILSGQIPAGTELTQVELADSLGVSRMPVREALILLEYQGLIRRLPNNHVRVAAFDAGFFRELFAVASALEREVLKTCIPSMEVGELGFHRHLWQAAENAYTSKTLETITEVYLEYGIRNYDTSSSAALLAEVCAAASAADEHKVSTLLDDYFSSLAAVFTKEGE